MPSIGPVPDADCASSRRECVSGFFKISKTSRGSGLPKFSKRAVGRMRKKRKDAGQKRGPYKKRTGYNDSKHGSLRHSHPRAYRCWYQMRERGFAGDGCCCFGDVGFVRSPAGRATVTGPPPTACRKRPAPPLCPLKRTRTANLSLNPISRVANP
jgi:hypothetical protein